MWFQYLGHTHSAKGHTTDPLKKGYRRYESVVNIREGRLVFYPPQQSPHGWARFLQGSEGAAVVVGPPGNEIHPDPALKMQKRARKTFMLLLAVSLWGLNVSDHKMSLLYTATVTMYRLAFYSMRFCHIRKHVKKKTNIVPLLFIHEWIKNLWRFEQFFISLKKPQPWLESQVFEYVRLE